MDLIEDQDINLHTYVHLSFDREDKNTHWKKRQNLQQNYAGQTGHLHVEECEKVHIYHPA